MIYKDYRRNHVILPGRERDLETFLKQDYIGMQHKWKNRLNSNSEDAYQGRNNFSFKNGKFKEDEIQIYIGKQYPGSSTNESTEVDASIELPKKLIFIEAKLYSPMSMALPSNKPHDQIARKLRIGLDSPLNDTREFFFIFLDIASLEKLKKRKNKSEALAAVKKGFDDKWKSAWLFNYYKFGRNSSLSPLKKALEGINTPPIQFIADNMGWLTWSDLFKSILRGVVTE